VSDRNRSGSVVFDRRTNCWNFLRWENGRRRSKRIGTTRKFPTRASAWRAAKDLRHALENNQPVTVSAAIVPTVAALVEQYRKEKMPQRYSTRRSYECWLNGHILPRWGASPLTDLQARPVELWLSSLELAPKSRAHVRGLVRKLWDFAMWSGSIPTTRNPIELVTVLGASKRMKQPRSLRVEEFQRFVKHLSEPFRTIALLCCCLGLRISECLALRWADVDWLASELTVERGIVCQHVGDTKTAGSHGHLSIDSGLLEVLKAWKQTTQFPAQGDWLFASPFKLGRLPWSYPWIWRVFQNAAVDAGTGKLGTHTMRHSFRAWLDAVGTGVAVQQKLMRHADIRTTMNVYGNVVTNEMTTASSKVAGLAINGL
jgi:integrase